MAGEYPIKADEASARRRIEKYLDCGITYFVDLTNIGEKPQYESILKTVATSKGLESWGYIRLPIQDFGIPSKEEMINILNTIDKAISKKHKVYVHCRGGIGRTGTTVGCYLARHGPFKYGEEALDEVNRLFQNSGRSYESSYSPETREQMDFVTTWEEK